MNPNTAPLPGVAVGPGLFLVELGEIYARFAPHGWSREDFLALLRSLGVRTLLGPNNGIWLLKEALDLALTAALHPQHPLGEVEPFTPGRHRVSRRFVEDHRDNIVACLLAYRSHNLISNRAVDRSALHAALSHLGESISRYHAARGGGEEADAEMERVWMKRRDLSDVAAGAPPPQVEPNSTDP